MEIGFGVLRRDVERGVKAFGGLRPVAQAREGMAVRKPGGGFAGGLVAGMALMIRYLAAGSRELDEAAPVDAGKVLGAGLALAALGLLAPAAFGGRIGQSYDISTDLGLLGSPHLVTSVFFDVGVYLVVVGVVLDVLRSFGSEIDRQIDEETHGHTPTVARGPEQQEAVR